MRKQEVDHILTKMLDSFNNVSDLNLTVGKPLQVESSGLLVGVDLESAIQELTPFQTEIFAPVLVPGQCALQHWSGFHSPGSHPLLPQLRYPTVRFDRLAHIAGSGSPAIDLYRR